MAVIGRILQAIGWIWLALGFLGPLLNLPIDLGIFPGIILIFISRIFRTRAARKAPEEAEAQASVEEQVEPRVLNTERPRPRPAQPEPGTRPTPEPARSEAPKPVPETKRQEMLEQILISGTGVADGSATRNTDEVDTGRDESAAPSQPLSSAEMIARAHQRWNKRP